MHKNYRSHPVPNMCPIKFVQTSIKVPAADPSSVAPVSLLPELLPSAVASRFIIFLKARRGRGEVKRFEIPLSPPQFPFDTEGVNGGRGGK